MWVQFIIFGALAFGLYAVLGLISLFLITSVYKISLQEILNPATAAAVSAAKVAQTIISIGLFGVTALLFGYLSDQRPLRYLGFKKPFPSTFWLISITLLLVATPAVAWLAELNQNVHFPKALSGLEKTLRGAESQQEIVFKKLLVMSSPKDLLINLLVFALIPAFVEELFFRGALQHLFIKVCKSPLAGIIITAIIFSAIHGQFSGFLARFVLGALLGALYWYSGSLWPGIIMHILNNALQIIVYYNNPASMETNPHFAIWLIVLSFLAIVLVIMWMRKISQTKLSDLYNTDDLMIESIGEDDE